jgi:D-beta-D-heptose 7-phosphate kinase/D-beta-D-heptose 1-phosphate adenosyltransferase
LSLITHILPDVLVKGGDYNPDTLVGSDIVRQNGGKVIVSRFVDGQSTTSILERAGR